MTKLSVQSVRYAYSEFETTVPQARGRSDCEKSGNRKKNYNNALAIILIIIIIITACLICAQTLIVKTYNIGP